MPTSPDGILEAVFDPVWASVRLIVDGGMWPSSVDTITVTRGVAGEAVVPVRNLESRLVVGGYYVGTDHEMGLDTSVTYRVDGYLGEALVATTTVIVDTTGAADGMWLKVAGAPDLTVRARIRSLSEVSSSTIGGLYQIAGGGAVAQWSDTESEKASAALSVDAGVGVARLRAALTASRVLLLQPVGMSDLDPGWYYIDTAARVNPAQVEGFSQRWFNLGLQRTGVPAGAGTGVGSTSWAGLMESHATWADVLAGFNSWFDVLKGA